MKQPSKLLLVLALLCCTTAIAQTTRSEIAAYPERAGGIYHSYNYNPGPEVMTPAGYTPFYISHFGRHGSRWHSSHQAYDYPVGVLRKAAKAGVLTAKGQQLLDQVEVLVADAENRYGDLSPRGEIEHRAIAERMFKAYSEVFSTRDGRVCRVESRSTVVPRCILSMAAFNERLKELKPSIVTTREASQRYMPILSNRTGMLSVNEAAKAVGDSLRLIRTNPERLMQTLFTDPGFAKKPIELMRALYMLAVITQDVSYLNISFYDLFTNEELYTLWETENIRWYLTMGPSARFGDVITADAKPLLRDMIETTQAVIDGRSDLSASLRFGHDVNLIPLTALLGFEGSASQRVANLDELATKWSVQNVSPMAGNVQLIFFRNKAEKVLVRVLHNEHDAQLPIEGAPYYEWETFRDYCRTRYN